MVDAVTVGLAAVVITIVVASLYPEFSPGEAIADKVNALGETVKDFISPSIDEQSTISTPEKSPMDGLLPSVPTPYDPNLTDTLPLNPDPMVTNDENPYTENITPEKKPISEMNFAELAESLNPTPPPPGGHEFDITKATMPEDEPEGQYLLYSLNDGQKIILPEPYIPQHSTGEDPQPEGEKSGNDPYVARGEDNSKPWFYPVGNSIDCLGVERGQHDADRWLECPTYKFHKQTKVLVNNPMIGQPYNYEDFLGTHFTHVWQDANENMRIDQGETEEQVCDMLPTDVWGFPKYQPNGNKSTGKYYCSQIQEHFYAVDIVYMMKGI